MQSSPTRQNISDFQRILKAFPKSYLEIIDNLPVIVFNAKTSEGDRLLCMMEIDQILSVDVEKHSCVALTPKQLNKIAKKARRAQRLMLDWIHNTQSGYEWQEQGR